jgi:cell filamentation protein
MSKKSIRFFNDREVRAVWDEEHSKWWFSATDIVCAINDEEDYKKCRNYWKYLKGKFAKDGIQLVSVTNQFKFQAPDGKQRAADALDAECVKTWWIKGHPVIQRTISEKNKTFSRKSDFLNI